MRDRKFLDLFELDCKYYDTEQKEVKELIKLVSPTGKTILDVGAGIGRISFPLAKYAKKIVSLDMDKRLMSFYKKNKKKNLVFVNKSLEEYSKESKTKFDVILIAWSIFDNTFVNSLKKISNKNTLIVTITGDKRSENHKLINQLLKSSPSNEKSGRINPRRLKLIKKRLVNVKIIYPSTEVALKAIEADFLLWENKKLTNPEKSKIMKTLLRNKKGNKIIINEISAIRVFKIGDYTL